MFLELDLDIPADSGTQFSEASAAESLPIVSMDEAVRTLLQLRQFACTRGLLEADLAFLDRFKSALLQLSQ